MSTALAGFDGASAAKERIAKALGNLAIARQASDFGDAAQRVYVHLLGDLDAAIVGRACEVWARRPRGEFAPTMPTAADIRATVADLQREDQQAEAARRILPMPADLESEPRYFCLDCRDEPSGWRVFWCDGIGPHRSGDRPAQAKGLGVLFCGHQKAHGPHSLAGRCECYGINPVVGRKRQQQAERHSR